MAKEKKEYPTFCGKEFEEQQLINLQEYLKIVKEEFRTKNIDIETYRSEKNATLSSIRDYKGYIASRASRIIRK